MAPQPIQTRVPPGWSVPVTRRLVRVLPALLAALLLGGCLDANTLGGDSPTVVAVGSPPTWDNGVGTLMRTQCAVCHQVPRPPTSPNLVPDRFDLRYHLVSPDGVPGAADAAVLLRIQQGILRGTAPGLPRMPPDYATPLVEAEVTALEQWAAAGGP